jgi:hypothetical protein
MKTYFLWIVKFFFYLSHIYYIFMVYCLLGQYLLLFMVKMNLFQFVLNNFFCSTLSEFENFLLCERILINVTTCQNETSS